MANADTSRTPRDSVRISSIDPPGFGPADGRVPTVGESIYCVEGPAEVIAVLGKTSDGSRLLQLRCESRPQPFFASSSNVLLRAVEGV